MDLHLNNYEKLRLRRYGTVIGVTAVYAFIVMVIGSLTRATSSGLACPDWPLCYDRLVPSFDFQIFMEWFHRLIAGGLVLVLGYATYKIFRDRILRKVYGSALIVAAALLFWQVILGGLTVLEILDPKIVSWHLSNAVLFLSVLLWVFVRSRSFSLLNIPIKPIEVKPSVVALFWVVAGALFVQIFLGGMVSTNNAGLACSEFPTCNGSWWPATIWPVGLQMVHRFMAFIVTILVLALMIYCLGSKLSPWSRRAVLGLPILTALQIGLGVINVYFQLPVWASVAHLANAVLMFSMAFVAATELQLLSVHFSTRIRYAQRPKMACIGDESLVESK